MKEKREKLRAEKEVRDAAEAERRAESEKQRKVQEDVSSICHVIIYIRNFYDFVSINNILFYVFILIILLICVNIMLFAYDYSSDVLIDGICHII